MNLNRHKAMPRSCQSFRPFFSILHSIPPSSLGQIKNKLKDASDRFENMGRTVKSEDAKVLSELMGDIQNAITDFQVSGNTQPGSAT